MEGHSTSEYHHFKKAREGWLACSHNPQKVLRNGEYQYHHSCAQKSCLREVFPYRHKQLKNASLNSLTFAFVRSRIEFNTGTPLEQYSTKPKKKINDHIQKQLN
jgi:hypothetical protein